MLLLMMCMCQGGMLGGTQAQEILAGAGVKPGGNGNSSLARYLRSQQGGRVCLGIEQGGIGNRNSAWLLHQ